MRENFKTFNVSWGHQQNLFPDGYVTLPENLKNEWLFLKFQVTNVSITNLNFTLLPTFPRRLKLEKCKTFLLCLHSLIKTLSIKLYKPETKLKVSITVSNFEFSQAIQTRKTFFIAWVWRWDFLEQQRFIHTDGPWIEVVSLAKLSEGPWYWGSWLIIKLSSVTFVIVSVMELSRKIVVERRCILYFIE